MPDVKLSQLLAQSPATVGEGAKLWTHKGHIEGLKLEWVSGTSLRVTSGSAFIESLGYAIDVPAAITKSGLTLSASTWYHVYLFLNAGVPDIEVVTTAPASAYSGSARSKSGDSTRRYLGSVRTLASGALAKFDVSGNAVHYAENILAAPLYILNGGTATDPTNVSLQNCIPVTSRDALFFAQNSNATYIVNLGHSETAEPLGNSVLSSFVIPGTATQLRVGTDSARQVQYKFRGTVSGGGLHLFCSGYIYQR